MVEVFLVRPDQLSIWRLKSYIDHLRQNNQLTDTWELAYWNKLVLPLATAVMVVLALPFVFRQLRTGGLGRNLFIGIMLGLAFYVFSKSFGYIVLAFGAAPWLGATLPLLVFSLIGLFMLRRIS